MFERKIVMIRTAVVLVALQQGVASYGYAHESATEYLPEIIIGRLRGVCDQSHKTVKSIKMIVICLTMASSYL